MSPAIGTFNLRFTSVFAPIAGGESGFALQQYNTAGNYHSYYQFFDISDNNAYMTGTYVNSTTWSGGAPAILKFNKINHKTKAVEFTKGFLTGINFYRGAYPAHVKLDSSENVYFGFNTDPYPSGGGSTENRPFLGKMDSSGNMIFSYDRNSDRSQMAVYSAVISGSDIIYTGHSNPGASGIFWVDTTSGAASGGLKTMASGGYANGYTRALLSTGKAVQCWVPSSVFYFAQLGTDGSVSNVYAISNGTNSWMFNDSSDNVYMAGYNGSSGLIAKTSGGTSATWSRQFAANTITNSAGDVDSSGNVYTAYSSRYATGPDRHYTYLCKYNSSGTLQWQKKLSCDFNSSLNVYQLIFRNGCVHLVGYVGNFSNSTRSLYMKIPVTSTPINQTIAFSNGSNITIENGDGSDSAGSFSLSASSISFNNTNYGATNFNSGITNITSFSAATKDIV